jgi:hypothetical protein
MAAKTKTREDRPATIEEGNELHLKPPLYVEAGKEGHSENVEEISIDKLIPFHDHTFKLYSGERMQELVSSIADGGILQPLIVRRSPSAGNADKLICKNL